MPGYFGVVRAPPFFFGVASLADGWFIFKFNCAASTSRRETGQRFSWRSTIPKMIRALAAGLKGKEKQKVSANRRAATDILRQPESVCSLSACLGVFQEIYLSRETFTAGNRGTARAP